MPFDNNDYSENGGYEVMKAKYQGYEAKKSGGFIELPPVGAYIGTILNVKVEPSYDKSHDQIVLMLDITEGEYAGRFMEQYNDTKERFPETKYKGVLRITVPEETDGDDLAWIKTVFEGNLWAIEQSNPGYAWDWDEKKLKGKKVGFSIRERYYTYDHKDRTAIEIGKLESIEEIKAGKVKPMKARDTRKKDDTEGGNSSSEGTDVTGSVEVPF